MRPAPIRRAARERGATATDAFAATADPALVIVSPCTGVDAIGRRTFGFAFPNFENVVRVTNGTTGNEVASARTNLDFVVTSLDPLVVVSREDQCDAPRPNALEPNSGMWADIERKNAGDTHAIDGTVSVGLDRVTFTIPGVVAPEPATLALVAGGLALPGLGRRRR